MMALLTPLNVSCHASDGRKVVPFATNFVQHEIMFVF